MPQLMYLVSCFVAVFVLTVTISAAGCAGQDQKVS